MSLIYKDVNSIELINIIKKMLADRLTTSEREQLLNEKPMVNFQSQQWDKAPKAHIPYFRNTII